jgi:hypothetical protein
MTPYLPQKEFFHIGDYLLTFYYIFALLFPNPFDGLPHTLCVVTYVEKSFSGTLGLIWNYALFFEQRGS